MSGNEIFKKMYSVSSGANFFFVFNFSFINQGVPTSFSSTIQDGTTIYHRQLFFLRGNTGTMIFFSFPNWTLVQLFSFLFCTFLNTHREKRGGSFERKQNFTSLWYFGGDVKWTIDEDWRYETVVLSDWQRKKNNN